MDVDVVQLSDPFGRVAGRGLNLCSRIKGAAVVREFLLESWKVLRNTYVDEL